MAYGAWAVSLPAFSGAATAAVLAGGAAAVLWGAIRRRRPARTAGGAVERRAVWPWAALVAILAIWQLAAYVQNPRIDHPTLSSLTNALLDSHPARTLAFVAWTAMAAELARR